MNESVHTSLHNEFALEEVILVGYRQLDSDYNGLTAVSVIDDLFEVDLQFAFKQLYTEIVDYQHVAIVYLLKEVGLSALEFGEFEVFHEPVHCEADHLLLSASPVSDGVREIRLSGSRRTRDEHGYSVVNVFSSSHFTDLCESEISGGKPFRLSGEKSHSTYRSNTSAIVEAHWR